VPRQDRNVGDVAAASTNHSQGLQCRRRKTRKGGPRRVKNDERDAIDLIDMLRLGRLPEAWIAPPATRELRELVRYRAKLVALWSGLKAQVHAVMAKEGVLPAVTDMFCRAGNA
jgi:hypothetical protein